MKCVRSKQLYKEALKYFPGGVNSPVRAFGAVGGTPLFIKKGLGAVIQDEDGNKYVDQVMSWGALILGHANPVVVKAVSDAVRNGSSFGAPTSSETELARIIGQAIPSMERMRFVSSGTEATMSAIRLSRGFTGRNKIIKFAGCYHGHCDSLLVKAGSGAATQGIPGSAGVSAVISGDTLVCPYNDLAYFRRLIARFAKDLACVIIEPVAANMGVVLPREDFMHEVRNLTAKHGILLIFDEVISGFRFHFGGVQTLQNIRPDLTCLGKIIGGGLPIGAYGGRKDILARVAPLGDVYQAGTLSGNPLAVAAGLAVLNTLKKSDYTILDQRTLELCQGLTEQFKHNKTPVVINRAGSLFTIFFTARPVTDFASACQADPDRYARFFWTMLRQGINLPPSQFEAQFLSFSHTSRNIDQILTSAGKLGK
ncbi:MAG: glutamate-1-semialdehyde 2,1-aminomutase [Candidatus Omnitrophica bacterium]|nr:glutamate-1-semialdehyde 2,1-aminomutase [Candidatus Omnitrophota bacterium]